jgi:pimeloyl-ACP methyl ester carboxylesterase
MAKISNDPQDYIVPLIINGLEGRMLHVPAPKGYEREILMLYGHHALIERWWGLVQNYSQYGAVTMPDLPGFGGMDSFAKIGRKPTIDNFADYLAAFIKLRYKRKQVTIVAISFGFVVTTRMLQKYPELAKRVNLVVSLVGFMHRDDFLFTPRRRYFLRQIVRLLATRPMAFTIRYVFLTPFVLKNLYSKLSVSKRRFVDVEPLEFGKMLDFEVVLWQANDVRTHWLTTHEFLNLDNCQKQIALPVWHVAAKHDHYFNNYNVEQHMRVVYQNYTQVVTNTSAHTPSILSDKRGMSVWLPRGIRQVFAKTTAQ